MQTALARRAGLAPAVASPSRPAASRRPAAPRTRRSQALRAELGGRGAASGLAVEGQSPTSPNAWRTISTSLKQAGVQLVPPGMAERAAAAGAVIVDIRPAGEFARGRLPGSVNAEFFRLIAGWSPGQVARRAAFAFFGVLNGTELNPEFLSEVEGVAPKGKPVVLVCNVGGTLDPTGPSEYGRQSRSLTAAYELLKAGYKDIKVLDGGYNGWVKSEREVEVDAE